MAPDISHLTWVTGAGGLIGSHIVRVGAAFVGLGSIRGWARSQLDLCDFGAVEQAFKLDRPKLVIHCAAMSKSPECQAQPGAARRINVDATKHLAELASDTDFVFLSTDLVFDGRTGQYDEAAPVNPLSVYAETKVAAEQAVLTNPRHLVIRTSLTAGPSPTRDRGFDEQLRLAWERGEIPRLFTDEYRSPIGAEVTARALWELVMRNSSGLYHLAGAEKLSRSEIGQLLQSQWPELNPQIEATSLRQYRGAPRAPDTSLDCRKAQHILSFRLPGFREWLSAKTPEPAAIST